jgi:hypothetical protein
MPLICAYLRWSRTATDMHPVDLTASPSLEIEPVCGSHFASEGWLWKVVRVDASADYPGAFKGPCDSSVFVCDPVRALKPA